MQQTLLYLEAFIDCDENRCDDDEITVTLETCIVLFLLQFLDQPSNIKVHLVAANGQSITNIQIPIRRNAFDFVIQTQDEYRTTVASKCCLPVFVSEENVIIAGLCGVCRAIIKCTAQTHRYLLGFKESCLLAPSEASTWTKFCEIDMMECTKNILTFHNEQLLKRSEASSSRTIEYELPNEIACFESHMSQPVRVHNIHKVAQKLAKSEQNEKSPTASTSTSTNATEIEHKFVEDLHISIADIVLFPNFWLIANECKKYAINALQTELPLTWKWIQRVQHEPQIEKALNIFIEQSSNDNYTELQIKYNVKSVGKFSLYKHEPKRYKSKNRIFTRQEDIDRSLQKVSALGIEFTSESHVDERRLDTIDWQSLPYEALPEGGNLPEKRLQRKKDQLNGLVREIVQIAKDGECIVDFCSGAGHLGILLAHQLPSCTIYLLENKEESLMRAKQRCDQMNLRNVYFFQCNLDYFIGDFSIGTSLHACGVASDIVLMHCIHRRAKFVCCPCCYGQCNEMPHISYPRSKLFRENHIELNDYLYIAHCADQTKTGNVEKSCQGQRCMDIIDTDRKLYTEEFGYRTILTRLYPEDCTPKNRLLVGII